ncbi:hypothetical protein [Streptomyces sp. NPDC091268]|uniref:hypothetical protein n=1 Tax=Streptomyces sp. NPDC091268 TaxID=3365979 RepID=UPI003802C0BC
MQRRLARSVLGVTVAGIGIAALAACTASAGVKTAKPTPSTTTDSSPPSPAASMSRAEEEAAAIEKARSFVLTLDNVKGKDAPSKQGFAVAAVEGSSAVALTWLTTDGRFCHATISGFSQIACDSRPKPPPGSETPQLVRYEGDPWLGWIEYFAADHEKAVSATCNGAPLPIRQLQTTADGKRTLYGVAFTERRKGSITAPYSAAPKPPRNISPVDGLYAEGPDCT